MFVNFRKFAPTLAAMMLLSQLVYAEPVNVNTADAAALAKALNGIGPAKAKAIVSYRDKNGPFKSVDQLAMVEGITQKLIDKNRADIKLGAEKAAMPARLPRRLRSPRRNRRRRTTPAAARGVTSRKLSRPGACLWQSRAQQRGMVSAPKLGWSPYACREEEPRRRRRFPGCRSRNTLPPGHQGQPQRDAAHRRQATHSICSGRSIGRGCAPPGLHHGLFQARHRRSFRFRRRTRESAAEAGQERPAEDAQERAALVCVLHLHPPASAARPGPRGAVRQARRGRCAVFRASRRRPHRRARSLPQANEQSLRQRQHRRRADRAAFADRQVRHREDRFAPRGPAARRKDRRKAQALGGAVESRGRRPLPADATRVHAPRAHRRRARAARSSSPTASRGS